MFFSETPEVTAEPEKKTESPTENENNSTSLIKPPLPVFKNISNNPTTSTSGKQNVLANVFSSRGARLLKMSKEKISSSPSGATSSCSSQDSPSTSSYRY